MTELKQIYKCKICGNLVEVLHAGVGELVCCEQPMQLMEEQTADYKTEKHVPVIVENKEGVTVSVGSVPHPMEEKHYIEWIEVIAKGRSYKEFLKPGDAPKAYFCVPVEDISKAREYCNIHGLWASE